MTSKIASALLASAFFSAPALAQSAVAPQPAVIEVPVVEPVAVASVPVAPAEALLPVGTEVVLTVNNQLSSRDSRMGDNFPLTVARDVVVDGHVVIPAGTRAVGQVTFRDGRGSFGSSGKLEVTMRYVELNGQHVPVQGFHRQEGEGNTGATVGAMLAAGVIGGMLVKGKNARIPEGFEITSLTTDAIPVLVPAEAGAPAAIAASYSPSAIGNELGRRRDQRRDRRREQRPTGLN